MANQFASGETYADGQTVNAARLNNTVNLATAQPGLITEQGLVTPVPADQLLLEQASSGLLKRATIGGIAGLTAYFQGAKANPPGTTVLVTGVMMGLPGVITPTYSGRIFFSASGFCGTDTTGCGISINLRYGTGSKPVNGDAATGLGPGAEAAYYGPGTVALTGIPFCLTALDVGLTLNTAYWLDVSVYAITGGTAKLANATICAFEF